MSLSAKSFSLFQRDIFLFFANLVTGIIVARKLGPEALGIFVILQMIPAYAESLGRIKVDIAAVYLLGIGKYQLADMVFTLNLFAIVTSSLIILPIIWHLSWFKQLLFGDSVAGVGLYMYIMLTQIPFHFLYMNYSYLYIYKEDIYTYNRLVIIRTISLSIINLTLIIVFNMGIMAVVIGSTLSILLGLLYAIISFGRTGRSTLWINIPLIKDLLSYGFKLYLGGIIGHLNAYLTRTILVLYLQPASVAFFSMAQGQGELIAKIPNAINTILYPRITKTEESDNRAILAARAFRVVLLLLIVVGLLGFILIKPAVRLLYGPAFVPMVVPFWIILPGLVFSGAGTVLNQYFVAVGRADIGAKIAIIPLIIQTTMGFVLIPKIGIVGAALSFLISLLILAIIQIFIFVRLTKFTIADVILIGKEDLKTVTNFIVSKITESLHKLNSGKINW